MQTTLSKLILDNIFKEYQSNPGLEGEKGHGLGLKIAKELAMSLKGDVFIESIVGAGTKITIKLIVFHASLINLKTSRLCK